MTVTELQKMFLPAIAPEDFFILLAHATKKKKVFFLAHPEYALDPKDETLARDYFRRRLKHEPIAYIVGHKEFYGYDFLVTQDTLIPRPETELLVESALKHASTKSQQLTVNNKQKLAIIDVGTGSGNIIISIAKEIEKRYQVSGIRYYAADFSEAALVIARQNAKRHDGDGLIKFHKGDLLQPLDKKIFSTSEIVITANLPYLSHSLYDNTSEDVHAYEPREALLSERAGLDHYYRLLEDIKSFHMQKHPITLFLEISPEQRLPLQSFVLEFFPRAKMQIHEDLAQKERVVEIHIQ